MAIKKKPSQQPIEQKQQEEAIEKFISGGLTEPAASTPAKPQKQAIQKILLRLPEELVAKLDAIASTRKPALSRHQLILEALYSLVESGEDEED